MPAIEDQRKNQSYSLPFTLQRKIKALSMEETEGNASAMLEILICEGLEARRQRPVENKLTK